MYLNSESTQLVHLFLREALHESNPDSVDSDEVFIDFLRTKKEMLKLHLLKCQNCGFFFLRGKGRTKETMQQMQLKNSSKMSLQKKLVFLKKQEGKEMSEKQILPILPQGDEAKTDEVWPIRASSASLRSCSLTVGNEGRVFGKCARTSMTTGMMTAMTDVQ